MDESSEFPLEFIASLEPENQELIKDIMADAKNGTLKEKLTSMAMDTIEGEEKRAQDSMLVCGRCKIGHEALRLETGRELLVCSGCNKAKYCSKECQKVDWKDGQHKGMCKMMKNPDKGKFRVYDQFEEWKIKNSIKLKKIFRALLFKVPDDDEEDSDGYNLCDDHFAVLGIDYTPGATVPFQINFSEAIPEAFFGVDMNALIGKSPMKMAKIGMALAEASYLANKDHALMNYIDSKNSFLAMYGYAMSARGKGMLDLRKCEEQINQECEMVIGIILVNVLPIYGQSIAKTMPEILSAEVLLEDTEHTDRHMLQALLNGGHGDFNHNVFKMEY